MPTQNRFNTLLMPVALADGTNVNSFAVTAAAYAIFDCRGNKVVEKTLAGGGMVPVTDTATGENIFQIVLTDTESDLCGKQDHEMKIALTGAEWLGVQLDPNYINFTKTRL